MGIERIKIIIVDDHKLFRDGLKTMFSQEQRIEIVGEAGTADEFFKLMQYTEADVILLDIILPDVSGVDIAMWLNRKYPKVKILILTAEENKSILHQLITIGINGFVSKDIPFDELMDAIETIAEGGEYFGEDIARLMYSVRISKPYINNRIFTPREMQIIDLCTQGLTAKEIGNKLNVSLKTVVTHKYNIFKKLGINSTLELVSYALKNNLINL